MVFEVITSDRKPKFFAPLSANDHSFPPFYHRKTKTPSRTVSLFNFERGGEIN